MSDSPLLWYLNRATGTVVMVLLTLVVVLGILATFGRAGRGVPRFVTQAFHRQVSLLAVAMLAAHVLTAVLDTFVDIRWWQAVVPFGGSYRPMWLGLGALALDGIAVVVATSLVRTRMGHRRWGAVQILGYHAWASAVAHGVGIGTDSPSGWSRVLTLGCVGAVALATVVRAAVVVVPARRDRQMGGVR
jgi:sulfoxide reductase heme-binding subunit YedZ